MNSRISVITLCLGVLNHPFVYCLRESIPVYPRIPVPVPVHSLRIRTVPTLSVLAAVPVPVSAHGSVAVPCHLYTVIYYNSATFESETWFQHVRNQKTGNIITSTLLYM